MRRHGVNVFSRWLVYFLAATALCEDLPTVKAAGPDLSTPLAAARSYAESLRDADAKKFRSCLHTENQIQRKAADAMARWVTSSTALRKAAVAKFGETNAAQVIGAIDFPNAYDRGVESLANLSNADVTVEQDGGTVLLEPIGKLEMRKLDGSWKVLVTFAPQDKEGKDCIAILMAAADAQELIARRINAGDFRTAQDAREAFIQGGKNPENEDKAASPAVAQSSLAPRERAKSPPMKPPRRASPAPRDPR